MSPTGGCSYFIIFLYASFVYVTVGQNMDWNSPIVASDREKFLQDRDALTNYFGAQKNNISLFPTSEEMMKKIGVFEDVDPSKIMNHNYNNMTAWLLEVSLAYPDITWLYSAGKSVQGRDLWVLVISDKPKVHELLEPELKYVGNMHGNEVVGRETLLYFIDVLCKNYGKNTYITSFVNNNRLHIMPSMNPDGYEMGYPGDRIGYAGRSNVNNVDLNRNFPTRYPDHREESGGGDPEKEVRVMMKWLKEYPFVLSANFHGGSLVANYPLDDSILGNDVYSASLDDILFVEMAYRYARAHSTMWQSGRRCGLSKDGDTFINGITNGAGWYHLAGGMQDWQYEHTNSMEITIEMGCFKFPTDDMLPKLWEEHRMSLFAFLEMIEYSVYGLVTDQNGKPIANASVFVEQGKSVTTTKDGEYWRILSPGDHILTFEANGLEPSAVFIKQFEEKRTRRDVKLFPCGANDNSTNLIRRGKGDIVIVVAGISSRASEALRELARLTCSLDFELDSQVALLIIPLFKPGEAVEAIRKLNASSLLIVSDGFVESLTFSTMESQPKLFNKDKLDESLRKAIGTGPDCQKPLRESSVALSISDIGLTSTFELGIAIGCDTNTSLQQIAATIGTTVNMLRKAITTDAVKEFSVVPSANPSDHYTPSESVLVTSAAIPVLEELKCLTEVSAPAPLKLYKMGSGSPPYTLVVSLENRTETLVYEMMSRWCENTTLEGVGNILQQSTLIMMPVLPVTQYNCHDYGTIAPFQQVLSDVLKFVPQIDFILNFGTGGVKLRYINETGGFADRLSKVYKAVHPIMQDANTDICNGGIPQERDAVRGILWNEGSMMGPKVEWKRPDALLVQAGCCHETGVGHLYDENRKSIIALMTERLRGLRVIADSPEVVVVDKDGKMLPVGKTGTIFIPLSNGIHEFTVLRNGRILEKFSVQISTNNSTSVKTIHSNNSSLLGSNFFVVSTVSLLILLACCFGCRQRVSSVLNRRGFFTGSRSGFERIPLYKSDDEDEDEIFDLQKL